MDYRKYYKEYFKIEISNDYDVHHIDMDRSNNNISNLILIPKRLHKKYHYAVRALMSYNIKDNKYMIDPTELIESDSFRIKAINTFHDAIEEMNYWNLAKVSRYTYKKYPGIDHTESKEEILTNNFNFA